MREVYEGLACKGAVQGWAGMKGDGTVTYIS